MFQDMTREVTGISIAAAQVTRRALFHHAEDGSGRSGVGRDTITSIFPAAQSRRSARACYGHHPDAAIHYAKLCREGRLLTFARRRGLRTNSP